VAQGCRKLVLAGRDRAKGAAAVERLQALGAEAGFVSLDLGEVRAAIAMVDEASERMGSVTALVNSAASTDRAGILDATPELWDRMFAVNCTGPSFALQRFAQLAIAAGRGGSVVNVLSTNIHGGQSFLTPYSASKSALANVTKNAAQSLRRKRIRVNAVNPGWMDTPAEDAVQKKFHNAPDDWLAQAEAKAPFGMLVKPAHVAGLIAYLLGPASGVMTGAVIDFDQHVAGGSAE
jgi:NAD(P)-dependent dehydrogenase (short-subunit alcohol dehydrogenase family)